MAWIKTIPWSAANKQLRRAIEKQKRLYPTEYEMSDQTEYEMSDQTLDSINESIVNSHSLIPDALYHAFANFGVLMAPELPLTRKQHEMISTVVSTTNRCDYWITSHAEFLRQVTLDENLVKTLIDDYTTAPVSRGDAVMLNYAVKLTKDATSITSTDHKNLRTAGFNDQAILQITLIAAWFNYINRVADALGVGKD